MKSRRAFSSHIAFLVVFTVMLGGCFGGSRSILPDYYLLTARTADVQPSKNFSIGVGPVRIAPFLARQQIVTHQGNSSLDILPQRWGEPLEHGIQRVLLQNLAALTGAQSRGFPWRQSTTPDYAVRIDVIDLDRLNGNTAILDVSWILEDLKNHRVIATQQTRLTSAINGSDTKALVDAYSDLWQQLAQRVTQTLVAGK